MRKLFCTLIVALALAPALGGCSDKPPMLSKEELEEIKKNPPGKPPDPTVAAPGGPMIPGPPKQPTPPNVEEASKQTGR